MAGEDAAALVTGAASGIGEATVRRLAADGVRRFVLVDLRAGPLAEAAEELRAAGAEVLTAVHDVADPQAWADTEQAARARFGALSAVVANAGLADAAPLADMSFEAWRRILSANLDGVFLTLQAGFRLVRDGGAMAVVASAAAVKAEPGIAAYAASKAGALQLARVAAKEGAPRRVRVNAVLPGGVTTPIWREVPFFRQLVDEAGGDEGAAFDRMAAMATPLGRYATAEEVAAQVAWLLSDAAGVMTGAFVLMDGGYTL